MGIHLHLSAVRGDDGADEAEAETEPGLAADVTAIEAIPDVIDMLGRDSRPGIGDGDCDRAKARSYGTRSVLRRAVGPALIVTRPPDGVYFTALSTRLASTWRSLGRSALTMRPLGAADVSVICFCSATSS